MIKLVINSLFIVFILYTGYSLWDLSHLGGVAYLFVIGAFVAVYVHH